jgi:hypothetical protein
MIDSGFGMSLLYGLVLAMVCGSIALVARYTDRAPWLRAVYDYSGFIIVLTPVAILVWHITYVQEQRHERRRNAATEVPMVREDNAPERAMPEDKCPRVLSAAIARAAGAAEACRVSPPASVIIQ